LDRSVACTSDAECPACIPGKGGGVTATPAASADGEDLYMASVGCLSFPSIGNSESIFKLDAATGSIDWVHRTQSTEQFQSFVGGPTYHDYGFLNGPILATVDNGTVPVAVAGNKDGTIYAVNQVTGLLEWSNVLAPPPVFAGFGLFNGAVAYEAATDQFFASLYDINTYPSGNDDVLSFGGADGVTGWSDNMGTSWSSPTVANGLLFTGNLGASAVLAYDTTVGTQLAALPVPAGNVIGGTAIDNGVLYVPYGNIFGTQGGIVAYELPAAP
ncbi:MAG: PQQ-binding-like beta-propeller repeat protein, partial [Candidatus Binatia bacterium]